MRKIINGKVYNSETAKLIASNHPIEGRDNFNFLSYGIYKKKTGEYFVLEKYWYKEKCFREDISHLGQTEAESIYISMFLYSHSSSTHNTLKIERPDNLIKDAMNILAEEMKKYRKDDTYGKYS